MPLVSFYNPLKTSKNLDFSDVFREVQKETRVMKWVSKLDELYLYYCNHNEFMEKYGQSVNIKCFYMIQLTDTFSGCNEKKQGRKHSVENFSLKLLVMLLLNFKFLSEKIIYVPRYYKFFIMKLNVFHIITATIYEKTKYCMLEGTLFLF